MERKFDISGNYKVKMAKIFSLDFVYFSNFYLPIIDVQSYSLYLFLFSEAQNNFANLYFLKTKRIIDFLNLSEASIGKGIKYLEFLNLIEVYKTNEKNNYIYVVKAPLSITSFDNNLKFKELLKSKIGQENYDLNLRNYSHKIYSHSDTNHLMSTEYQFENNKKIIIENKVTKLDFIPLFNVLEETKINYHKFWNKEIEETIKDVIILYKLSILDVVNIFKYMNKDNIKITSNEFYNAVKRKFNFKIQNLDKVIENEKISLENKDKLLKNTNPLEFLHLILGRDPNAKEIKIITNLRDKYKFNDYIINILIDYSNIVNNGFVIPNYIYSISDSLVKAEILKSKDIINYLKTAYKIKKHKEKTEEINLESLNISNNDLESDKEIDLGDFGWKRE